MTLERLRKYIDSPEAQTIFERLTGDFASAQPARYARLLARFEERFGSGADCALLSAPGRAEIGGNHTDHNNGRVLAAAVTLDMAAVAARREDERVILWSEGYEQPFEVDLRELEPREAEYGITEAIIRGVADGLRRRGFELGGFNAVMDSAVLPGSGLSSSAAVQMLVATIFEVLYNLHALKPLDKAKIGQYAENVHFGKPSGLMDQTASSLGSLVSIDFGKDEPVVDVIDYDFSEHGFSCVVVNPGGGHADLNDAYAAITREMGQVAAYFGCRTLRDVPYAMFDAALPELATALPHRAILRAAHFFEENDRVLMQVAALRSGQMDAFLSLVRQSGLSSYRWLQNCFMPEAHYQPIALALWLSERILGNAGACRVHGGGFAGTILAFVPKDMLNEYIQAMNGVFGANAATTLQVRAAGAVRID